MGLAEQFQALQRDRLLECWRADVDGSGVPHVMIGLPSFALDRTVYDHYGDRVPPLENRYAYALLAARDPSRRVVYVSSLPVCDDVMDGYLGLVDEPTRALVRERSVVMSADDPSRRSLAEKVLDRGDLIDRIRAFIGEQPALVEPWNVTEAEAALAVALGAPIHGTDPAVRGLATKSNGRRLFRDAGVPVPDGEEGLRSPADVAEAVTRLQRRRPGLSSVVVKLDDSVAGDGNVVVDVAALPPPGPGRVAAVDTLLPGWYTEVLAGGGVVEERIVGEDFRSPSAQATITPAGEVVVLSTHEQRLGGDNGQVFLGCSFPADEAYAARLGAYAVATGRRLAEHGACGRFAVDFVACRGASGGWDLFALEVNLRKGGTTHPYGITRIVARGRYDADRGVYLDAEGRPTYYGATDNLVEEAWVGRPPGEVRAAADRAGLSYDHGTGTGVVPHLLDCLAVDGRFGYTAIAKSREAVSPLEERFVAAVHD